MCRQRRCDGGAERAREVHATLSPVKAGACEVSPGATAGRQVDAKLAELCRAFWDDREFRVAVDEPMLVEHCVEQRSPSAPARWLWQVRASSNDRAALDCRSDRTGVARQICENDSGASAPAAFGQPVVAVPAGVDYCD
jgi:hypothetical protein